MAAGKKAAYTSQMSKFIALMESPIRWLHFLFSFHDNSFPTDLNAATFFERLDCLKPGAIDQKNNIQLQCLKHPAAMYLELFCSLGGEGSNIYIFFC